MKITKKEFDSLYTKTITKYNYDQIIQKINDRFSEILIDLYKQKSPKKLGWYDYGNQTSETDGYFDPKEYKESIGIIAEYAIVEPFEYGIPTRWLWEDYHQEMIDMIEKEKQDLISQKEKQKLNRQQNKERKQKLIESIKGKLSKEELKVITFKKI